jgi:predicted lipid-binding transport protein (Tim44 family)
MASVYSINRNVNRPVQFKGLKGQWMYKMAAVLVMLLLTFAILYICGVAAILCVVIVFSAGGFLIHRIYKFNDKYGEHGLMKKNCARQIILKVQSRKIFMHHAAKNH